MKRIWAGLALLAGVVGCDDHQARVLYRPEPTCDGELLSGSESRDYEILLGRLMTWAAGPVERARDQAPIEVARYFEMDALIGDLESARFRGTDEATLFGTAFLEVLDPSQRQELVALGDDTATALTRFQVARDALIDELWSPRRGREIDGNEVTALAAQAGRAEGQVAVRAIAALERILETLSATQRARLEEVAADPIAAGNVSDEVEQLLRSADEAWLLALAAKGFSRSQSPDGQSPESRRKVAPYFGYAYFVFAQEGADVRRDVSLDVHAQLDLPQRELACSAVNDQESDIEAYQDTRAVFLNSAYATAQQDPENLLSLHATLGSHQGRLGLGQARLFQGIYESLDAAQLETFQMLYAEAEGE